MNHHYVITEADELIFCFDCKMEPEELEKFMIEAIIQKELDKMEKFNINAIT